LARLVASLGLGVCIAQEAKPSDVTPATQKSPVITNQSLPTGARIYIAPMPNGFDTYVVAGLEKKKVPVTVVTDREKADYELSGVSDTDQAGWAKMLFMGLAADERNREHQDHQSEDRRHRIRLFGQQDKLV
jgi:hypothetical protein